MSNIPQHPLGWKCESCACWLLDKAGEEYLGPQGAIPVKVAVAQGMSVAGMLRTKTSVCTEGPQWTKTAFNQFCWRWKDRKATEGIANVS